jgi:hypothetical protein
VTTSNAQNAEDVWTLKTRLDVLAGAAYSFHYQVHSPDREVLFVECQSNNCAKWRRAIESPAHIDGEARTDG